MLRIPDNVLDCAAKYEVDDRKEFLYSLIMQAYFGQIPEDLEKQPWKDDYAFFAPELKRLPDSLEDLAEIGTYEEEDLEEPDLD